VNKSLALSQLNSQQGPQDHAIQLLVIRCKGPTWLVHIYSSISNFLVGAKETPYAFTIISRSTLLRKRPSRLSVFILLPDRSNRYADDQLQQRPSTNFSDLYSANSLTSNAPIACAVVTAVVIVVKYHALRRSCTSGTRETFPKCFAKTPHSLDTTPPRLLLDCHLELRRLVDRAVTFPNRVDGLSALTISLVIVKLPVSTTWRIEWLNRSSLPAES
jgi:hypothetical protein